MKDEGGIHLIPYISKSFYSLDPFTVLTWKTNFKRGKIHHREMIRKSIKKPRIIFIAHTTRAAYLWL